MKTKETLNQLKASASTSPLLRTMVAFSIFSVVSFFSVMAFSLTAPVYATDSPEHCEELFGSSGSDYESCIAQFDDGSGATTTENEPPDFGVECEGHDPESGCCNGVRVSVGVDCEQNQNPILGYLAGILNFLAGGVIVVVTGMIVVGGVQYITSGGVPQKLEAARKRIADALIALVIFIFLYAILQWLIPGGLFG